MSEVKRSAEGACFLIECYAKHAARSQRGVLGIRHDDVTRRNKLFDTEGSRISFRRLLLSAEGRRFSSRI
jgi:hypothetical protein